MKKWHKILIALLTLLFGGGLAYSLKPSSSGFTHIEWTQPMVNVGGSPLTDLAGFIIYCGTASGNYTITVDTNLPALKSAGPDGNVYEYPLSGVFTASGVFYCSVTTYNSGGRESANSPEISIPYSATTPSAATGVRGIKK